MRDTHYNVGVGRGGKGVGDYFAHCGRSAGHSCVHVGKTFYLSARLVFDTFAAAARVKSSEFLGPCLARMGGTHLARAIGDAANAEENIPVMEILMW